MELAKILWLLISLLLGIAESQNLLDIASVDASGNQEGGHASNLITRTGGWGSGGFAPAWVELTLSAPANITQIRARVQQQPDGETKHDIYIDGQLQSSWEGITKVNDWLELDTSIVGISVKVLTTVSPSWVAWSNIDVYGYPHCVTDADAVCDDGNPCTYETCVNSVCVNDAGLLNCVESIEDTSTSDNVCVFRANLCSTCSNMDDEWMDSRGDTCTGYEDSPTLCHVAAEFPNENVDAKEICCVCGGGQPSEHWDLHEAVVNLDGDLSSVSSAILDIDTDLQTVQTDVTNISDDLGEVQTAVLDLDGDISAVSTAVSDIDTDLETIQTDVSSIIEDVSSVGTDVEEVQTAVLDLDGDVIAVSTAVLDIDTDLEAVQTDVTTIKTGVANVETNVEEVQTAVFDLDGDVSAVSTDIETLQSDVVTLQTAVSSIEVSVAAMFDYLKNMDVPINACVRYGGIAGSGGDKDICCAKDCGDCVQDAACSHVGADSECCPGIIREVQKDCGDNPTGAPCVVLTP